MCKFVNIIISLILLSVLACSSIPADKVTLADQSIPNVSLATWKIGDYTDYEINEFENGKKIDNYILSRKFISEIEVDGKKRKIIELEIKRDGKTTVSYRIMLFHDIEELIKKNPFYITNYSPNFSYALKLKTKPAGFPCAEVDFLNLGEDMQLGGLKTLLPPPSSVNENTKSGIDGKKEAGMTTKRELDFKESPAGILYEAIKNKEEDKYRLTLDKFQKTIKKCKPIKKKVRDKEFICDCYQGKMIMPIAHNNTQITEYKVTQTSKIPLTGVVDLEVNIEKEKKTSRYVMVLVDYGSKTSGPMDK